MPRKAHFNVSPVASLCNILLHTFALCPFPLIEDRKRTERTSVLIFTAYPVHTVHCTVYWENKNAEIKKRDMTMMFCIQRPVSASLLQALCGLWTSPDQRNPCETQTCIKQTAEKQRVFSRLFHLCRKQSRKSYGPLTRNAHRPNIHTRSHKRAQNLEPCAPLSDSTGTSPIRHAVNTPDSFFNKIFQSRLVFPTLIPLYICVNYYTWLQLNRI